MNLSSSGWEVSGRRWVTRSGLSRLLDDLALSPGSMSTHYLPPGPISALVGETETGAAVFVGESQSVAIVPPFPMGVDGAFEGLHAAPLTEAVEKDRLVGVLLVRLGRYAVGVVNSAGLVAPKTDTRHVKNRHRAGGSSQRRFERSRERLIRELFDKVCVVAKDVLGPYEDRMDYLFLGGERQTLLGTHEEMPVPERVGAYNDEAGPGRAPSGAERTAARRGRGLEEPDPGTGAYVATGYCAVQAPSTARGIPVTKEASSEAR